MKVEHTLQRAKAGTGAKVDFSGNWKNELTSSMTVFQNGSVVSGTYTSAVSGGGVSTSGDLAGYVDGDLMAFVVHWRDFQAITSWVGQLEGGSLKTLWQMTKQVDAGEEWSSINAGSDVFVRVP